MLRLALIENLRRVGARIIAHRMGRDLADFWADQMTRDRAERSEEPDPGDRGHGAVQPAHEQFLRRGTRAPAAGPERGAGDAAHLDRAAARPSSA